MWRSPCFSDSSETVLAQDRAVNYLPGSACASAEYRSKDSHRQIDFLFFFFS
jgi:hypothetical protein